MRHPSRKSKGRRALTQRGGPLRHKPPSAGACQHQSDITVPTIIHLLCYIPRVLVFDNEATVGCVAPQPQCDEHRRWDKDSHGEAVETIQTITIL